MALKMLLIISCIFSLGSRSGSSNIQTDKLNDLSHQTPLVKTYFVADHTGWGTLLKKYVDNDGNVDYNNFMNDLPALDNYLEYLAQNVPQHTAAKNVRLAFYINLYNAATVKLILDNYPLKSIKDISGPWDKKWVKVGKETLSLGNIEHQILRKMNEPRIHFAINCASFSCPKLNNKAFTAAGMDTQLEEATRAFINDTTRNIITKDKLQLSNIFKWYKKDFTSQMGLADYINTYTNVQIESNAKIEYLNYNWKLNASK